MKLHTKNEHYTIYQGSMLDLLQDIKPQSIDSVVTDPPYELNFMNKGWDRSGIAFQPNTWKQCYEALKPGGYLLAFGGSRTFHRIAVAIEDAGFEIRDVIMWVYGSGFPKSLNIGLAVDKINGVESKVVSNGRSGKSSHAFQSEETTTAGEYEIKEAQNEWQGWGTALKPAYEPVIVARKPLWFEIDNINYVHKKLLEKNIEVKKWLSNVNDVEKQKNILYSILINLQVMGETYVNNANLKEIKFIEKIIQTYIKKDMQNGEAKIQTEKNNSQKMQMKNYVTKYLTTTDENVLVVVKIEKNFLHLTTSMEMVQNIDVKQEDILIEIYENKDFLKMDTEYFVGTVMHPLECMDIVHTIK